MQPIDYTYQGVTLTNFYAYEGWFLITNKDSIQYRLKSEAGESYDSEGFAKIGERYVIADAASEDGGYFGNVGDFVDWEMPDGSILKTIVGETKDPGDADWIPLGHFDEEDHTRVNVIEFLVSRDWYNPPHENPGTPSCHPEWAGQIRGFEIVGNYWGNQYPGVDGNPGVVGRTSPVAYISPAGADMLELHFKSGNPILFYKQNTLWIPRESTNVTVSTPETPTGSWARANEALAWCQANRDIWPYVNAFTDGNGDYRGLALDRGTGCDCSGFVAKLLYNFAPNVYVFGDSAPDTYALWDAYHTYWDSSTAADPDVCPVDWLEPGDLAFFSSGWYAGEEFPRTYTETTKRHVLIYMLDGRFWDMTTPEGPDNLEYGIEQTPQNVWDVRGWVSGTRWCLCRPNFGRG